MGMQQWALDILIEGEVLRVQTEAIRSHLLTTRAMLEDARWRCLEALTRAGPPSTKAGSAPGGVPDATGLFLSGADRWSPQHAQSAH